MPSQKQEFSYPGKSTEQLLQLSFGTFLSLGWMPKYAGPTAIVGYTPRRWNKYEDEVLIEASDGAIVITSSLIHNESFDITGKNKRHIKDFITVFNRINSSASKSEWAVEIEQLREQTIATVTQQAKQHEEVDNVMNLSGSNLYATYTIMAINVIVFILMAMDGAGIFAPNALVHIKWGSNVTALTLSGDWWRLLTSTFIHFGIIHLAMNMYALYTAGVYLEPMLGKAKYIAAYLCTGVIAGIISLWWHKEGVNSAGASGAIFGMYGVFLALLLTNLIPKQMRSALLQSIGIFVVFNIVYGMRSGIDNAAHIGGLISGFVIGFVFYLLLKREDKIAKSNIVLVAIISVTVLSAWLYLNSPGNKINQQERQIIINEIDQLRFADAEVYNNKMKAFGELEEEALAPFNEQPPLNAVELSDKLSTVSNDKWQRALEILEKAKTYNVSEKQKKQVEILREYVLSRQQEIKIIVEAARNGNLENNERMDAINKKISDLLQQYKDLN